MKAPVTPLAQRLAVKLDVALPYEALILNRLARVPKARREEWLRGLLVQGFQQECRSLQKLQRDGVASNEPQRQRIATPSLAVNRAIPMPRPKTRPADDSTDMTAPPSRNTVTFAALRKVIG